MVGTFLSFFGILFHLLPGRYFSSFLIPSIFLCVLGTILGSFFAAFWGSSSTSLNVIQVGELGHFLLGSTSRDMARWVENWKKSDEKCFHQKFATREIGYGDLACFASDKNFTEICKQRCICEFFRKSDLHQTKFSGKIFSFRSEEDCNNGCTWQHTGLGLDYQVLNIWQISLNRNLIFPDDARC